MAQSSLNMFYRLLRHQPPALSRHSGSRNNVIRHWCSVMRCGVARYWIPSYREDIV